jgi:nucleoid-associated protein YgaU
MRIASLVFGSLLLLALTAPAGAEEPTPREADPADAGPPAAGALAALGSPDAASGALAEPPPAGPTASLPSGPGGEAGEGLSPLEGLPPQVAPALEESAPSPEPGPAATPLAPQASAEPASTPLSLEDGGSADPAPLEAASAPSAPELAPDADLSGSGSKPPPAGIVLGPIGYDSEGRLGRIHVVDRGDTLWDISEAYLGTPWIWPSIWGDNPDVANPHRIYPGDRIWITPTEMRRVTSEEAEQLLAGQPLPSAPEPEPVPAAIEEAPLQRAPSRTYFWSAIEATGFVTNEQLEAAASIVDSPLSVIYFAQGHSVYIGLGEGEVQVGDQLSVVRAVTPVRDPVTGESLGVYVEKLGWLEVSEVHPEASLGKIRASSSEMRRGDLLLPRRMPSEEIAVLPTPMGLEGRIVYTPDGRTAMGDTDIVFLNRGTDHGLAAGHELEVYRPGRLRLEAVRNGKVQLPDHVVAHLLVVSAQPETAVAVVTGAKLELVRGDRFRGHGGLQPQ